MFRFALSVIVLCLVNTALAWYKCDDIPFCRDFWKRTNKAIYLLDQSSSVLTGSGLTGTLVSDEDRLNLTIEIANLDSGAWRIRIDDPLNPRYSANQALDGEPQKRNVESILGNRKIVFYNGDVNLQVTFGTPNLQIDMYREHELLLSLNSEERMLFQNESVGGAIAMDFQMNFTELIGLPERSTLLNLRQSSHLNDDGEYRLYNVDYPDYKTFQGEGLYGSIPVMYAHTVSSTVGIFWLNAAQTFVKFDGKKRNSAYFVSESGVMDIFLFPGPKLKDCVRQFTQLTGVAPQPPMFALGYHQSRYSYLSQNDLETVVDRMDQNDIPLDVMWLDIDHTDGRRYFMWNYTAFPDPIFMQRKLNSTGRKLVVIVDPHYKADPDYYIYAEALKQGFLVKNKTDAPYIAKCWPGMSGYVDFSNPDASQWYSNLFHPDRFANSSNVIHIWNDMNEPSVFDVDEKTMPGDNIHFNGVQHRELHNMYGFYHVRSTHEGLKSRPDAGRPFVLTRSHFAGSQRYAAVWTGDNYASWDYLQTSISMCITLSLSGMSFCGADVGGFDGNPDDDLFTRWYQLGAWLPFFRGHSSDDTKRREPFLFPDIVRDDLRRSIRQRYQYLPLWYTLFYEHRAYAAPILRPLTYDYQDDERFIGTQEFVFMIGKNVLVAPVTLGDINFVDVVFPGTAQKETWFYLTDFDREYQIFRSDNTTQYQSVEVDHIPVFHRGGTILVRKNIPRASSYLMRYDPISLYIFLNQTYMAEGTLYVDDENTFSYEKDEFKYFSLLFANNRLTFNVLDGNWHTADYNVSIGDIRFYANNVNYTLATIMFKGQPKSQIDIDPPDFSICPQLVNVSVYDVRVDSDFEIVFK